MGPHPTASYSVPGSVLNRESGGGASASHVTYCVLYPQSRDTAEQGQLTRDYGVESHDMLRN